LLTQAIADARAGRRDDAARYLRQIVNNDPGNVDAWIWLGGTATDVQEQRRALERALALDPNNGRAQQGLRWLRTTAPQAFEPPAPPAPSPSAAAPAIAPQPQNDQRRTHTQDGTPRFNTLDDIAQRAAAPTQAVERSAVWGADQHHAATPPTGNARPALYEQPTVPMPVPQNTPVAATFRQEAPIAAPRRAAQVIPQRPAPPLARTEAMPAASGHARPRRERTGGANVARWILLCLWLLGLGAMLTLTAFIILALVTDAPLLDNVVRSMLRPFGLGVDFLGTPERSGILAGTLGVVMLDLVILFGIYAGRRWAWWIAVLVALLTFAGAIALLALPLLLALPQFSYSFADPLAPTLFGLFGFTLALLLVTLASRRAFRRAAPQHDEQYDDRYEAYGR
jgi:tetratricopeptide (TPR) repeat protein